MLRLPPGTVLRLTNDRLNTKKLGKLVRCEEKVFVVETLVTEAMRQYYNTTWIQERLHYTDYGLESYGTRWNQVNWVSIESRPPRKKPVKAVEQNVIAWQKAGF